MTAQRTRIYLPDYTDAYLFFLFPLPCSPTTAIDWFFTLTRYRLIFTLQHWVATDSTRERSVTVVQNMVLFKVLCEYFLWKFKYVCWRICYIKFCSFINVSTGTAISTSVHHRSTRLTLTLCARLGRYFFHFRRTNGRPVWNVGVWHEQSLGCCCSSMCVWAKKYIQTNVYVCLLVEGAAAMPGLPC